MKFELVHKNREQESESERKHNQNPMTSINFEKEKLRGFLFFTSFSLLAQKQREKTEMRICKKQWVVSAQIAD